MQPYKTNSAILLLIKPLLRLYITVQIVRKNMGLTTWKNSPSGRILKSDTKVVKKLSTRK